MAEIYANIVACTPDRSAEPLTPSGNYIRVKDRPPREQSGPATNAPGAGSQTGYRRAQPAAEVTTDHAAVKVHVGRCKGLELRDLPPEQIQPLVTHWLPAAKANAKPTADDKRLMAALDWWVSTQPVTDDDFPY